MLLLVKKNKRQAAIWLTSPVYILVTHKSELPLVNYCNTKRQCHMAKAYAFAMLLTMSKMLKPAVI